MLTTARSSSPNSEEERGDQSLVWGLIRWRLTAIDDIRGAAVVGR